MSFSSFRGFKNQAAKNLESLRGKELQHVRKMSE